MQIFMRGIPLRTTEEDIGIAIARRIHRPPFPTSPLLNFHIDLFRPKKGSKFLNGLLTLPDAPSGELFLKTFPDGIPISTSKVLFSRNKNTPNVARITQVASTPWQDPEPLRNEAEMRKSASAEIPLVTFAFGRLCRDGAFSPEVRRDGESTVSCDIDNRRVRLSMGSRNRPSGLLSDALDFDWLSLESSFAPTLYASYRTSQILALCLTDDETPQGNHSIILEANAFPVLEKRHPLLQLLGDREPPAQRVESISEGSPMHYVGRFLLLTFESHDNLRSFTRGCKLMHIHSPIRSSIKIVQRDLYSKNIQVQCQRVLRHLPYPLAFEVDKAIYSGTIDLTEVIELHSVLQKLWREKGEDAAPIFRWFVTRIQAPSLQNLDRLSLIDIQGEFAGMVQKKRKNRRQRGKKKNRLPITESVAFEDPTLSDLLQLAAKVYTPETPRASPLIAPAPALYQSYHLILTPSSQILDGPLPDQSSSILRRFENNDCFIRVVFQDDNRMALRPDTIMNISIKDLLRDRYRRALVNGIDIAGRHFEFLGYSMSGLKQHSVFFVHPFNFNLETGKTLMTAEVIRSTLVR